MDKNTVTGMWPHHTQWWLDHQDIHPAVVLRCADCTKTKIGEIRMADDAVYLGAIIRIGERVQPNYPIAALTEDELIRERELVDEHVIKYVDDGQRIVAKRMDLGISVVPFDFAAQAGSASTMLRCPVHGERFVHDWDKLERFTRNTPVGKTRNFAV